MLFHLFMHSLVDSYMYPDWGSNPKPGSIRGCSNQLSYQARTGIQTFLQLISHGPTILGKDGTGQCTLYRTNQQLTPMGALEDLMISLSWKVRYLKRRAEGKGEEEGKCSLH